MSDMIDRLDEIARASGAQSGERLAAAEVAIAHQVRAGRRRRRVTTGVLAGAAALVVGVAAAIVVPLLADTPLPPANQGIVDVEQVISNRDGLTTYADGSMTVVNSRGVAVDVAPAADDAAAFRLIPTSDLCATDATGQVSPGWTFTDRAYQGLITFGRPQVVDATGFHTVTQGQRVQWSEKYPPAAAFSFEADTAVASHLVVRAVTWTVDAAGTTFAAQSVLDAEPTIDLVGDVASGTDTAVLQSSKLSFGAWCPGADLAVAGPATRYLSVTVFLNDGVGHAIPLATHDSWITITKEDG